MRLNKRQKEHLLALISEGLKTNEINVRAGKHKPPYQVSRSKVSWYRKTRRLQLSAIIDASENSALTSGLALKEKRVKKLNELGQKLGDEILGAKLWLEQMKKVGETEFEYQEFNQAEVREFRGVLDDLAKEMGDRRQKLEHSAPDGLKIEVVYAKRPIDPAGTSPGSGTGSK